MDPLVHLFLYTGVALLLLTGGGNLFCRAVFHFTGLTVVTPPDPVEPVKAGRVIGWLERLTMAIGLAAGSWEVLAAVIALKSVARFNELNNKAFAEYFLIGSLASLLWAAVVTGSWVAYDDLAGTKARGRITTILAPPHTEEDEQADEAVGNTRFPTSGSGTQAVLPSGEHRSLPGPPR